MTATPRAEIEQAQPFEGPIRCPAAVGRVMVDPPIRIEHRLMNDVTARLSMALADRYRIVVFEGGHFLPRAELVTESLKWLDKYLGPVPR